MNQNPHLQHYATLYLKKWRQAQRSTPSELPSQLTSGPKQVVQSKKDEAPVVVIDDEEDKSNTQQNIISYSLSMDVENHAETANVVADLHITGVSELKEWIDISELDIGKQAQTEVHSGREKQDKRTGNESTKNSEASAKKLLPVERHKSMEAEDQARPLAKASDNDESWADLNVEEEESEEEEEEESNAKFKCEHCPYKTDWKGNMSKHVISRHQSRDEIKWFECAHCPYKGKTREYLLTHLRQVHDQFATPFPCTSCPRVFKSKQALDGHVLVRHKDSEEIEWLKCAHCDYKSKSRNGLRAHFMNKHLDESKIKWHKCEHCQYKSKSRKVLRRHLVNRHTPDDKIPWAKCDKCEYKVKYRPLLKKHSRDHHPEGGQSKKGELANDIVDKELECRMCGYKTHSKIDFRTHFKFDGKSFHCD